MNKPTKDKLKFLDNLTADQAQDILEKLANEDPSVAARIEEMSQASLSDVDPDSIADSIFFALDNLQTEEVWDNAGSTSYGYVDPYDLAYEMFEDALAPYIDDLEKYQKIGMDKQSMLTCMGILKGLYTFDKESTTEFKGYVEDASKDKFGEIFDHWKLLDKTPKNILEMSEFINKNFPDWNK